MFSENERQIFEYTNWDGAKKYADPATVLRRIKEITKGQFNVLMKQMADQANPDVSSPAIKQLCDAIVYGFGITKVFDENTAEGWLEIQLVGLGDKFTSYINGLKKNTAAPAIGSQPTSG